MGTLHDRGERQIRLWGGIIAGVFAIIALSGLLALELLVFRPRAGGAGQTSWLFWIAAIPAYLLLQFFAEVVLQGFWGADSLAAKAVPVVCLVLFYAVYFHIAI